MRASKSKGIEKTKVREKRKKEKKFKEKTQVVLVQWKERKKCFDNPKSKIKIQSYKKEKGTKRKWL